MDKVVQIVGFVCWTLWTEMTRLSFFLLDGMDRDDQIVSFVCRMVWTEMTRLSVLCAGRYGQR